MKNLILQIFMLLLLVNPVFCQMYMWTDGNGVKHFSNIAPPPEEQNIKDSHETKYIDNNVNNIKSEKTIKEALNKKEALKKDWKKYQDKKKRKSKNEV